MASRALAVAALATALLLMLPIRVQAHGGGKGTGISVEPEEVTAGMTVVLEGSGLEADSDRVINLVGPDVVVPFDTVKTDEDGMFTVTLTIPGHLPSGTYTLQAIGDETLTTDLVVTAAPGQVASEPKNETAAVVVPRARTIGDIAVIVGIVLVAFVVGFLLIARAEWFGRMPQPHERSDL